MESSRTCRVTRSLRGETTMGEDPEAKKAYVAGVFSRVAATYDQVGPRFFSHFGRRLVDLAGLSQGARVLDVATGRGAVLFPAAERVGPSGWVIGIDVAGSMVEAVSQESRRRGLRNAEVRQMDAEHLEFQDETFDAVLCGFALFLFPHLETVLREFHRVLKSGGRIGFSTWGKVDERWSWIDPIDKAYNAEADLSSHKLDTPARCEEISRAAGWEDVRCVEESTEFVYADEEEWWATQWAHGSRAAMERVATDRLDRYKSELFAGLQAHKEPDGIHKVFPALFTVATKPAARGPS